MPITPQMASKNAPTMKGFKLPKGYASDNEDEVKEALLKFKDNKDGTAELISLDGATFKDTSDDNEEGESVTKAETQVGGEENSIPEGMGMEETIRTMQKKSMGR